MESITDEVGGAISDREKLRLEQEEVQYFKEFRTRTYRMYLRSDKWQEKGEKLSPIISTVVVFAGRAKIYRFIISITSTSSRRPWRISLFFVLLAINEIRGPPKLGYSGGYLIRVNLSIA